MIHFSQSISDKYACMTHFSFFLIFLLAISFVIGCSSGKQSDDSSKNDGIVRIDPNSRQRKILMLSEIIDSISYVPLETNDNCLLGTIREFFVLSENYLLIENKDFKLYLFSKTGKFISQIGNIGQGPGEYLYYDTYISRIDEKNSQVIIVTYNQRQLMYFDFSGKFIKSEPLPFTKVKGWISYCHSRLYNFHLVQEMNSGKNPYTYLVTDTAFNVITQKVKPVQFSWKGDIRFYPGVPFFHQYTYNDRIHTKELLLNDTLYTINDDYSFEPKYIISAGQYDVTVDIRSDPRFSTEMNSYLMPWSMFETNDYLFVLYRYQKKDIPCYYHKKEDKVTHIKTSSSGIPNDFDGGLDFWPAYQNNNELVAFYDAYQIVEHKKNANHFKLQGGEESIKRFDQMVRNLEAEDNPVMVIVKLK